MNARAAILAGLLIAALAVMPALAVAPTAQFNGTPTGGCSPLAVAFVDLSSYPGGTLNDLNWTFGDGSTSTSSNVTHTYTIAGGTGTATFTVVHWVNSTGGLGSDFETKSGYITVTGFCHTSIIDPNLLDFANLSTLIGNIAGIFPGIVVLVISMVPLYIIQGLTYLILGLLAGIVAWSASMWRR